MKLMIKNKQEKEFRFREGRTRVENTLNLPCESPRHVTIQKQKTRTKTINRGENESINLILPCESPRQLKTKTVKTKTIKTKTVKRGEPPHINSRSTL